MKALYFNDHGDFDQLHFGEFPDPILAAEEVLVKVEACALNHLDLWVLKGWKGLNLDFPHIGGADVAGTVETIGTDVNKWKTGQRVVINPGFAHKEDDYTKHGEECLSPHYHVLGEKNRGGFAQFIKVPQRVLAPLPDDIDFTHAAASLLVSLTSWRMLVGRAKLQAGETVLIVGAGGGVNSMSIQIAKYLGAKVIALTSSEEKIKQTIKLGAEHIINYKECPKWGKKVLDITNGKGADVVVDNVGRETLKQSLLACARGGRIVTVGNTSGPEISLDNRYLFTKQISLIGSSMGTNADFEVVTKLLWSKTLTPIIDSTMPLSEGKNAYQKLKEGSQFGKIVLTPE